jgi:hypothetical protein
LDDGVGRQGVQRLFCPRLRRELIDDAAREADVLGPRAEVALRKGEEVKRLALTRRFVEIRPQRVAGDARALEEVVALGKSEVDELAVVVARRAAQGLERQSRRRVAPGAEQPLCAAQFELVALSAVGNRLAIDPPRARGTSQIAEGKLEIQPRIGAERLNVVVRRLSGSAQA